MNNEKYKKLDQQELTKVVGGFWPLLALAFPYIMQALSQTVASFKMATSDSGSVKYQGYESKWEAEGGPEVKTAAKADSVKQIVYAY